jgi:4-methylaminobutanoate oxidase (formaldehyde-forming)
MSSAFDVVVIGGGVAGLSTAMQLATRGSTVIVLERERLGNGSTGRAAGLLGQLRGTAEHTRMLMDGVQIVKDLEQQADVEIFVQTGSLRIAETPERAKEICDLVEMGKSIGFDIDHMLPVEVAEKLPYMRTDDLIDACYCPTDGHLQPAELVQAYTKVGKKHGVEYRSNCPVEQIMVQGGKVYGVKTAGGEYHAPVVVNATGPWSYLVAGMVDTALPTAAMGHHYLTTRPDPGVPVDRMSPAVRDRHHRLYTRPESGGLIVGMYEAEPMEYDAEELPVDFDMSALKAPRDDYNLAMLIHSAQQRFPWINERTPMAITKGIMTFTPDGKPFCGEMPNVQGLYHCAGFSGHGIVQSPAIGVIMAELILNGKATYDIDAIEADRYFDVPGFQERAEIKAKCTAMYASYYGRVEGQSSQKGTS